LETDMEINADWIYSKLTEIAASMQAIPRIEKHLSDLNGTITTLQKKQSKHEARIRHLERMHEAGRARWAKVLSVGLKVLEGLAVAWVIYKLGIQ